MSKRKHRGTGRAQKNDWKAEMEDELSEEEAQELSGGVGMASLTPSSSFSSAVELHDTPRQEPKPQTLTPSVSPRVPGSKDEYEGPHHPGKTVAEGAAIGAGSGAVGGAAIGTAVMPVVGTIVGAGIGAVGGAILGADAGASKVAEEEFKDKAWPNIEKGKKEIKKSGDSFLKGVKDLFKGW